MNNLPTRLKTLRKKHQLSLANLAESTGITQGYLSKIERGLNEPSISTVLKLAEAYQMSISSLLGLEEDKEKVHIVRYEKPNSDKMHDSFHQTVAGNREKDIMKSFIIYPQIEAHSKKIYTPHEGEEFIFVLQGTIELNVENTSYQLATGDSAYFDANCHHQIFALNEEEKPEVLVVIAQK